MEIPFIKIPISQLVEEPKTCNAFRRFSHPGFNRKAFGGCTLCDFDNKQKLIELEYLDGSRFWIDISDVFGKVIAEAKEILLLDKDDEVIDSMSIVAVEEIKIKRTMYWKLILEVNDLPF